jgi:hypothetical protein
MKNARLLLALILAGAAACSAEPTGTLPEPPRNSIYAGGGTGTPPDSLSQPADSTKQKG